MAHSKGLESLKHWSDLSEVCYANYLKIWFIMIISVIGPSHVQTCYMNHSIQ